MPSQKPPTCDIDVRNLHAVGSMLADSAKRHYGVCASFCFRNNRPRGKIVLSVVMGPEAHLLVVGVHRITSAIRATLGDPDDAVEHGAYGVALLAAAHALEMHFVRRSFKGPGFDFFLAPSESRTMDPDDIFEDCWGFEVTGIMKGDKKAIRARLGRKRRQVEEATKLHPVLIAVVEFSAPVALFELQPVRV